MKLTHDQLHYYIESAWATYHHVNEDPRAKYRFGQALWTELPNEVTDHLHGTTKDFYYWSDDRATEIISIAYLEFIEQGE